MNTTTTYENRTLTLTYTLDRDTDRGAPHDEDSGHGVVIERPTPRYGHERGTGKAPHEWVLYHSGTSVLYDSQASHAVALAEGWGLGLEALKALEDDLATERGTAAFRAAFPRESISHPAWPKFVEEARRPATPAEITMRAVRNNFEYLRGWYQDQWYWIGVTVRGTDDRGFEYIDSLWGIESNAGEYIEDVRNQLEASVIAEWKAAVDMEESKAEAAEAAEARARARARAEAAASYLTDRALLLAWGAIVALRGEEDMPAQMARALVRSDSWWTQEALKAAILARGLRPNLPETPPMK